MNNGEHQGTGLPDFTSSLSVVDPAEIDRIVEYFSDYHAKDHTSRKEVKNSSSQRAQDAATAIAAVVSDAHLLEAVTILERMHDEDASLEYVFGPQSSASSLDVVGQPIVCGQIVIDACTRLGLPLAKSLYEYSIAEVQGKRPVITRISLPARAAVPPNPETSFPGALGYEAGPGYRIETALGSAEFYLTDGVTSELGFGQSIRSNVTRGGFDHHLPSDPFELAGSTARFFAPARAQVYGPTSKDVLLALAGLLIIGPWFGYVAHKNGISPLRTARATASSLRVLFEQYAKGGSGGRIPWVFSQFYVNAHRDPSSYAEVKAGFVITTESSQSTLVDTEEKWQRDSDLIRKVASGIRPSDPDAGKAPLVQSDWDKYALPYIYGRDRSFFTGTANTAIALRIGWALISYRSFRDHLDEADLFCQYQVQLTVDTIVGGWKRFDKIRKLGVEICNYFMAGKSLSEGFLRIITTEYDDVNGLVTERFEMTDRADIPLAASMATIRGVETYAEVLPSVLEKYPALSYLYDALESLYAQYKPAPAAFDAAAGVVGLTPEMISNLETRNRIAMIESYCFRVPLGFPSGAYEYTQYTSQTVAEIAEGAVYDNSFFADFLEAQITTVVSPKAPSVDPDYTIPLRTLLKFRKATSAGKAKVGFNLSKTKGRIPGTKNLRFDDAGDIDVGSRLTSNKKALVVIYSFAALTTVPFLKRGGELGTVLNPEKGGRRNDQGKTKTRIMYIRNVEALTLQAVWSSSLEDSQRSSLNYANMHAEGNKFKDLATAMKIIAEAANVNHARLTIYDILRVILQGDFPSYDNHMRYMITVMVAMMERGDWGPLRNFAAKDAPASARAMCDGFLASMKRYMTGGSVFVITEGDSSLFYLFVSSLTSGDLYTTLINSTFQEIGMWSWIISILPDILLPANEPSLIDGTWVKRHSVTSELLPLTPFSLNILPLRQVYGDDGIASADIKAPDGDAFKAIMSLKKLLAWAFQQMGMGVRHEDLVMSAFIGEFLNFYFRGGGLCRRARAPETSEHRSRPDGPERADGSLGSLVSGEILISYTARAFEVLGTYRTTSALGFSRAVPPRSAIWPRLDGSYIVLFPAVLPPYPCLVSRPGYVPESYNVLDVPTKDEVSMTVAEAVFDAVPAFASLMGVSVPVTAQQAGKPLTSDRLEAVGKAALALQTEFFMTGKTGSPDFASQIAKRDETIKTKYGESYLPFAIHNSMFMGAKASLADVLVDDRVVGKHIDADISQRTKDKTLYRQREFSTSGADPLKLILSEDVYADLFIRPYRNGNPASVSLVLRRSGATFSWGLHLPTVTGAAPELVALTMIFGTQSEEPPDAPTLPGTASFSPHPISGEKVHSLLKQYEAKGGSEPLSFLTDVLGYPPDLAEIVMRKRHAVSLLGWSETVKKWDTRKIPEVSISGHHLDAVVKAEFSTVIKAAVAANQMTTERYMLGLLRETMMSMLANEVLLYLRAYSGHLDSGKGFSLLSSLFTMGGKVGELRTVTVTH